MKVLKKLLLTIILVSFASASFAETKMRITLQLPLKAHLGQNLLVFKKELESRSDIKVEIYDSAQLYKDKEVPQAVGSGAIEAGVASLTRFAGTNPEVDVFYLPFLFDTEEKVRKATAQGSSIRKILDPAIAKTGALPLYYQAYGFAVMLSNKKPMKTPEDFKNKKIRVFGKTLGAFVTSLGGKPTLVSGSEQYLAYQRGTVDAGMTGVSGVKSRKLYQVMDTLTVTNHGDIEFVVVVNQKWYNKLNSKQKKAIQEASKIAEKAVRDDIANIEASSYKVAKENGMKIVKLSSSELAALKKGSASVINDYIKKTGGNGGVGDKLVKAAKKL
jgi:C4-dicarboxylate-binding protein DctP